MNDSSAGFVFSVPYEIAVVRPLRQTTISEREEALTAAFYNTELIPQELIYIDLSTDSGVSSLSTGQLAAFAGASGLEPGMGLAAEGSRAFQSLKEQFQAIFGFPYVIATTQGRAAERIWSKLHVKPNGVVAGNMLFPSTRMHIEMNGAKVVDVIGEAAHDFESTELFKGNADLKKLETVFKEQGEKVCCVYVELAVNSCGGHPVSLGNLKGVKVLAAAHQVPLFLDACRIFENSYLIKQWEPGYQNRSIQEIVRETCDVADGLTMSALKDLLVPMGGLIGTRDPASYQKATMQGFLDGVQPPGSALEMISVAFREIFAAEAAVARRVEQVNYLWRRLNGGVPLVQPPGGHAVFIDVKRFLPHVTAENHPTEALAAFLYHMSGIRVTKGPPAAPSQIQRSVELLRLAVPARKYLQGHMDDAAEAVLYAYAHRNEIKGLKPIDEPGRAKYQPAHFTLL
ncbi:MAG: tryptophanase [Deltaproteobacteria bacterium]|nr:tryptophanase [Deltaproteobacteria bacterium]